MRGALSGQVKRKLLQMIAFACTDIHFYNYPGGKLYTGKFKQFCSPGLNCYSCPAAASACPIGALQAVTGSMKYSFPFYALGLILFMGVVLGRAICGFLCPFGLFQELLAMIPIPGRGNNRKDSKDSNDSKDIKKSDAKKIAGRRDLFKLPAFFRYVKYGILVFFVFVMPAFVVDYSGSGSPAFCKYICPAGTLEGGIPMLLSHPELRGMMGEIFTLKAFILFATIIMCVIFYRFFCRVICPLGAIYGILNKISLLHLEVDSAKCTKCGICSGVCGMGVDPVQNNRSPECIYCGECRDNCPHKAIRIGF